MSDHSVCKSALIEELAVQAGIPVVRRDWRQDLRDACKAARSGMPERDPAIAVTVLRVPLVEQERMTAAEWLAIYNESGD